MGDVTRDLYNEVRRLSDALVAERAENARLRERLDAWERHMSQVLNEGDGVYRP